MQSNSACRGALAEGHGEEGSLQPASYSYALRDYRLAATTTSPPVHLPKARDLVRIRLEFQFLVGDVVGDEGIERHRVGALGDQRQRLLVSGLAPILVDAGVALFQQG